MTDESFVETAVAKALKISESPGRPLLETLVAHLKGKALLLILDNCEHVIAEAAVLADALLCACPKLRILATSREPLRIAGEQTYRLPSLGVPPSDETIHLTAAGAARYTAVRLFAERAHASDHWFALSDDTAPIVAEICRRLDGIPLAIELAAACVRTMALRMVATSLNERFAVLVDGQRTALPRQQTMRASIDWSYHLLNARERVLFRRLAVFAGGWTLDAAETVCADESLAMPLVPGVLASLIDRSLIVVDLDAEPLRYGLLESTQAYAREQLETAGEREPIADRHMRWMAIFSERSFNQGWSEPLRRWLPPLIAELHNARAAMTWALGAGNDPIAAGQIAADFGRWAYACGLVGEARRWIASATERLDRRDDVIAARLWLSLGRLVSGAQRVDVSLKAAAVFERCRDLRRLGVAQVNLAGGYFQTLQLAEAVAAIDRARAIFRETGDARSGNYAVALGFQASALARLGRVVDARAAFAEALEIYDSLGDGDRGANERINVAELEFETGNVSRALAIAEEALAVLRAGAQSGFRMADFFQIAALGNVAAYALVLGDFEKARVAARTAVLQAHRAGFPRAAAIQLQHLAAVAALRGETSVAARLGGFVDETFRIDRTPRQPTEQQTYAILQATLRDRLDPQELERLSADGAALSEEQAIAMGLAIP